MNDEKLPRLCYLRLCRLLDKHISPKYNGALQLENFFKSYTKYSMCDIENGNQLREIKTELLNSFKEHLI